MKIRVNGQDRSLSTRQNLAVLLGGLNLASKAFAVSVNGQVIPRSEYESVVLKEGDEIEIVHPVGGG